MHTRSQTRLHDHNPDAASRRDLILVAAGTLVVWGLSIGFELYERVSEWMRPWERYELDELPGVLLFLALAMAWYAWRRVGEMREQLRARIDAERRLAETLEANRRLSLSHVQVQEQERRQLARELHDELGQHLNAIKIDAVSIRNWSEGRMHDVRDAARAIVGVTDHVQGIVRDMLHRLRPVGLDELGLSAAIEHLVQHWRSRNPAVRISLHVGNDMDRLSESENITFYRIVQESLNNVARHARASTVDISLQRDADHFHLSIADDGMGAGGWAGNGGLGLVGMRERIEALGGTLEIESAVGQGFRVRAILQAAVAS